MKLLIVDDEKLTRQGLLKSYNWKDLGINYIYEADDGVNGLYIAKKYKPDIILTDIRMPRMDGIKLGEEVHNLLPNSCLIFMSGYSDKKYLKAAIKLKAINYIEKPINSKEVKEAILEAIKNINQKKLTKKTVDIQKRERISKLVLSLNYSSPESTDLKYQEQLNELGLYMKANTKFNTIIFKIIDSQDFNNHLNLKFIEEFLAHYLNQKFFKINCQIHSMKQNKFIIFHVFYDADISKRYLEDVFNLVSKELSSLCDFYICIGKKVVGINNVYESYNSAAVLLENAFFHDLNSILIYKKNIENKENITNILDKLDKSFSLDLKNKKEEEIINSLEDTFLKLKGNPNILSYTAKEFYYRLLLKLEEGKGSFHIPQYDISKEDHSVLNDVMNCQTLEEVHNLLVSKVHEFFIRLKNTSEENINIIYIKEYISKNYRNNNLSIKSISDFIKLSPSYVCSIFKDETGKTLNQYITEYRIDKAKKLLYDHRNKITDIAYEVGYTDSNYFSKSFRKLVGISPTEFREKQIK